MDAARRERGALDAIAAEAVRSAVGGYAWGQRDCSTMIDALCAALGLTAPAYGEYRAKAEGRAAALALRRYGHLGAFHRALLLEAGGWHAVEHGPLEAGDVVSIGVRVDLPYGAVADPGTRGLHLTGLVCGWQWWSWGPHGLAAAPLHCIPDADEAVTITRAG